jgi:fucose 4-O-acetylase-like acetyltransferase
MPIAISIFYLIFKYLKMFPEFTFAIDQFVNVTLDKSENDFIFLIYGFIFVPIMVSFFYGAMAIFLFFTALYFTASGYFWGKGINAMSGSIRIVYIIAAILIYMVILNLVLGDFSTTE